MKHLFLLCLLIPSAFALQISIDLSDDTAKETIKAPAIQEDSFAFFTPTEPTGIFYEGEYSLHEIDGGFEIDFENNGLDPIQFTLLFDDLILSSGKDHAFHADFISSDNLSIDLLLPQGATLESMTPMGETDSDGQRIVLHWGMQEEASIAVFFQQQEDHTLIFAVPFILLVGAGIYAYFRRKTRIIIEDILSEDEQKVVSQLRNDVTLQKAVAKNLEFSKSKISKVIRKLEEKGLVTKEPHFKTNRLRLVRIA